MENQILIALKNNKLLTNVFFDNLNLTGIKGRLLTVSQGEILFREADLSNEIFLVVSGEINLLKKGALGKTLSLIYSGNDFFGCDEFIENSVRKSTAVALRDSYLISLSRGEVDLLINQSDEVLTNIYEIIRLDDEVSQETEPNLGENSTTIIPELSDNTNYPQESADNRNNNFERESIPGEQVSVPESEEREKNIIEIQEKLNDREPHNTTENGAPTNNITTDVGDSPGVAAEKEYNINSNESTEDEPEKYYTSETTAENIDESELETTNNVFDDTKVQWDDSPEPEMTESDFDFADKFGQIDPFYDGSSKEDEIKDLSDEKRLRDYEETSEPNSISETTGEGDMNDKNQNNLEEDLGKSSVEKNLEDSHTQVNADEKLQLKDYAESEQTIDHLQKINKAAAVVNSNIKIDDVLKNIVNVAMELTNADRGTLYLVDRDKNELWSKVAMGNEYKEIKLAMGEGIAGWVAENGEVINLENAHEDARFNVSYDKSSGYVTKSMICFPIRNKNEEIVGVLQLLNNVNGKFSKLDEEFLGSLSIHAALALQNAELVEQLLTSERVSSLGKMANFLIQDIKKPVLVSKRYAEHLKSKITKEDTIRVVDMLLDQLNHIVDLVQSTSSYSEGQIVLRSLVTKLNETLDDYITRIDSLVRSFNCDIKKEYDKDVDVKLSEKQFYQCFQHIIKNACEAMPEGGTIHLSTEFNRDKVNIIIKDNGLGIPENLHDKIFEPFMSYNKKETTGLGLSITKKIIEEHGGTIKVESEIGEGASFIITLPIIHSA